jgi:F-type H+-transporting ATPase subunit delta
MEELIAKRYVQALLSLSKSDEKSDFAQTLQNLSICFGDENISQMVNSPLISNDTKVKTLIESLGKGIDEKLVNFIKILGENGRLSIIPAISTILNSEMKKESNEYEGVVNSKTTLDSDALTELEDTLKRYTGSTIKLNQEESTLDGLRVSVDDLGIEVNFSKQRVKEQLIDFIKKSL